VPNLFLRFLSITAAAGVGLACVGLALVPAVQVLEGAGHSDEADIDLGPLDQRSYLYAADGSLLTTLQAEIDRQPVPLSEIPQHTVDAVLAVEDADFFAHDGVNLRATVRALVRNVDEGETVQGGSTITQQVVKEELVGNEQTVDRKAREAVLARRLEESMSKPEILERYLNTVYLGNGAYGVQAGAETYFGVGASQLDVAQSAFLAGLIANPSRFDPIREPDASRGRRDVALERMAAEGYLTADEAAYLASSPLPTTINQFNPETLDYFAEQVKQQLFDDPRLGATREERQNRVFRGGLRIHTTLDPRAQAAATTARNDVLAEIAPEGTPTGLVPLAPDTKSGLPRNATGAVVSVEPGTGAVRAMVGGAGFESEKFNVTTQGSGRSGGSTFKVFVLMALLENGYLPTDSVSGRGPCTFRGIPGMFPDPYEVENFGNSGGGTATILSQTLRSSNCAFVRLGQIVGIRNVVEQAHKMGITTPLDAVVSMPLGTKEVLPVDMAGALASIAADGMWHRPYYIDRVEDPDGEVLLQHEPDPRRSATVQSARLACDVLEKNVQSGTGTRARIPGQHAAGKTGTAQNASDGWFVGFTPYLATATWIGSPTDNEPVEIFGTGITGGSYPAEIWGRYMRAWHDGREERDCGDHEPANRSSRYLSMDRDNDSGGGSTRTYTPRRRRSSTTRTTESDGTPTTEVVDTTLPEVPTTTGGGDGGGDGGTDAGTTDAGGTDGGGTGGNGGGTAGATDGGATGGTD
jgi:penicillin-binding protein 1A